MVARAWLPAMELEPEPAEEGVPPGGDQPALATRPGVAGPGGGAAVEQWVRPVNCEKSWSVQRDGRWVEYGQRVRDQLDAAVEGCEQPQYTPSGSVDVGAERCVRLTMSPWVRQVRADDEERWRPVRPPAWLARAHPRWLLS